MHTTKQLVSSSSPARLPQSVANPQDPYIQMSKVLQTDGSNRACKLMVWLHHATQDAYHQAASQLVFTCTVAAICCKSSRSIHSNVKGLANRWQQPRLQPHGLESSSDARCIHQAASQLVFTCTVAASCCKSSRSIHSNVKGLANRWQQPRLQPHGLESSSNERCILPSS